MSNIFRDLLVHHGNHKFKLIDHGYLELYGTCIYGIIKNSILSGMQDHHAPWQMAIRLLLVTMVTDVYLTLYQTQTVHVHRTCV